MTSKTTLIRTNALETGFNKGFENRTKQKGEVRIPSGSLPLPLPLPRSRVSLPEEAQRYSEHLESNSHEALLGNCSVLKDCTGNPTKN